MIFRYIELLGDRTDWKMIKAMIFRYIELLADWKMIKAKIWPKHSRKKKKRKEVKEKIWSFFV